MMAHVVPVLGKQEERTQVLPFSEPMTVEAWQPTYDSGSSPDTPAAAASTTNSEREQTLFEQLSAAQHAARRRRWRITGVCSITALSTMLPGMVMTLVEDKTIQCIGIFATPFGFSVLLLAMLPTDRRLIQFAAWISAASAIFVAIPLIPQALHRSKVLLGFTFDEDLQAYPTWMLALFLLTTLAFIASDIWCVITCIHGAFRLHPAALLKRYWIVIKVMWLSWACNFAFITVLSLAAGPAGDHAMDPEGFGTLYSALRALQHLVLGSIHAWPNSRKKMQGWLASLGKEEIGAAAAVAALMAGHDVQTLRKEALNIFHYVPFDKVTRASMVDHAGTLDGKKVEESLYLESSHGVPGKVDAFISHSWHDPAAEKFEALQRWSKTFHDKYGRAPNCWLDKYCIDQTDLAKNLRCLPIFIAGCNRLVICWGPSFISRLWCVLELFVFLMMGGTVENIYILPIGGMNMASIGLSVQSFSMAGVQAFNQDDLDHIRGVMEAATAGDTAALIREMLDRAIIPETHRRSILLSDD